MTKFTIGVFAATALTAAAVAAGPTGARVHEASAAPPPSPSAVPAAKAGPLVVATPSGGVKKPSKPTPSPLPSIIRGRDFTLPLCEYEKNNDSFGWLFNGHEGWTCGADTDGTFTGQCGWDWNAACHATDQEAVRPTASHYAVYPSEAGEVSASGLNISWATGSAVYGALSVECRRVDPTRCNDELVLAAIEGRSVAGTTGSAVLFDIDGGFVDHLEPALVKGTVEIAYRAGNGSQSPVYQPGANDLTLAIQSQDGDGWVDAQTTQATSSKQLVRLSVETYIEPGTAVRLQVRGKGAGDYHSHYVIGDASLFVETCVLDAENPDACAE